MASSTPVPSRAAIHALRGLLFTTSCSVAFLAEERRRRLKTVKAAAENARKIHAAKVLRGAPVVDGLQPWEARLRERALEIHESSYNWDATLSPREVQRGIRRKKKRSTRKGSQHADASEAPKTTAPVTTVHDRGFRRLAVRPCLSTSHEQLARLKPAHRTFSTRHKKTNERLSSETIGAIFQDNTTSTRFAASKQKPHKTRKNTAASTARGLSDRSASVPDQYSPDALEVHLRNLALRADSSRTLSSRWSDEQVSAWEPGAENRARQVSPRGRRGEESRQAGSDLTAITSIMDSLEGLEDADELLLHRGLRQLLDLTRDSHGGYQEAAKSALRSLFSREDYANKLGGLQPELVTLLASTLLTPKWIATGNTGATNLLHAWETQHKLSPATDAQLRELRAVRDVRGGNWTALLNIVSLQSFIELAPTVLRTLVSIESDPAFLAVLDRLFSEGGYVPEAWDHTLLELQAVREARQGNWADVLPTLTKAKRARRTSLHTGIKAQLEEEDLGPGATKSASIIADLFVKNQPAAEHATFLCELYTIEPFNMRSQWMGPALHYFGEQRRLAEYLQWLDFGVSTDLQIDRKFAHTLHQSLRDHWGASNAVVKKWLRPQLNKSMVRDSRVDGRASNAAEDVKAIGSAIFRAAQRHDWEAIIEAYARGQEQGLPFNLGWLRWAVTAHVKRDGAHSIAADDLIVQAKAEGHDVSTLEDWLPTYRLKQGWTGCSLLEHTRKQGLYLSQPVYNSAIRHLVELRDFTGAWKLVCEEAEKHGNGRLAHDEYSLANTLDVLFAFDQSKMFGDIKAVLEDFISSRAVWHRSNVCRDRLMHHYHRTSRSREWQKQRVGSGAVSARQYAETCELQELLCEGFDHVKEMRELPEGFDGPGKIVTEVSKIIERNDLEHEPTADSPRRRPWFAKSFQERHMPWAEEVTHARETAGVQGYKENEGEQTKGVQVEGAQDQSVEEMCRQRRRSPTDKSYPQNQWGSSNPSSRFFVEPEPYQRLVATA